MSARSNVYLDVVLHYRRKSMLLVQVLCGRPNTIAEISCKGWLSRAPPKGRPSAPRARSTMRLKESVALTTHAECNQSAFELNHVHDFGWLLEAIMATRETQGCPHHTLTTAVTAPQASLPRRKLQGLAQ